MSAMRISLHALSEQMTDLYGQLIEATSKAGETAQVVDDARKGLEEAKAKTLNDYAADPKALGGNEEARKAKLLELCRVERDTLLLGEIEHRGAQLAVTLLNISADGCDRQLRIFEVFAKIAPAAIRA